MVSSTQILKETQQIYFFSATSRSSAYSLRRRECPVNKGNWPKTDTTRHTGPEAASHTSRRLLRPSIKRRHSTRRQPLPEPPLRHPNLSNTHTGPKTASLQGRRPCHPSDQSRHQRNEDEVRSRRSDLHTGPGPRTRLADKVDAERHEPKRADEAPDLQRRRPQGGSDDDVTDTRSDQGRNLDFHPKSLRHERRGR
jgi:hypothetical protein